MAPHPMKDHTARALSSRSIDSRSDNPPLVESSLEVLAARTDLHPSDVFRTLTARDGPQTIPPDHTGAVDPTSINMKGLQALFALIGAAFVLASIWFFFWAKNGGFHFKKGDWEEYKSTVLRRKGPNGTTLSNATKSTKLGGGSVVRDGYSDRDGSTWDGTMTETMTDLSSEAPIVKDNQNKSRKETAKERKIREAKAAAWEGGHDNDVRAYRHEKPARVGGINKDSDALHYGTDYTDTDGSVMQSHRPQRHGATRQDRRQSSRRDFSFGNDEAFSAVSSSQAEEQVPAYNSTQQPPVPPHKPGRYHSPSKQYTATDGRRGTPQGPRQNVPGGFHEHDSSDVQSHHTKSYHHPIPGLSGGQGRGFRRDRRDSLDD